MLFIEQNVGSKSKKSQKKAITCYLDGLGETGLQTQTRLPQLGLDKAFDVSQEPTLAKNRIQLRPVTFEPGIKATNQTPCPLTPIILKNLTNAFFIDLKVRRCKCYPRKVRVNHQAQVADVTYFAT